MKAVRMLVCSMLFLGIFFAAGAAEAQVACFNWDCDDSTGFCEFDASCTQNPGNLWRYRWDFGDGSGYTFTGSATISHQYSSASCFYPIVELTVIDYNIDPFSTDCQIVQRQCVGPAQGTSGQCSG
jgi:hypothetical protein